MARIRFIWLPVFLFLCLAARFLPLQALQGSSEVEPGSVAVITSQFESASYESTVAASNDDYSGRQWAIPKTMAPQAWEFTSGKASVVIAVLDTGIDKGHEDLVGKVIAEVNFADSPTADDVYGHGTHVAGIIAAAANNGAGIAGVAYDCRLLNVKVADDYGIFYGSVAAKGIRWAVEHGAMVINMSLFSTEPSRDLEEAINYAWSKGVVVVAAAGNCIGTKIAYPAYYSNCLAVAATDSNDYVASWSSQGDWVDVAAPGVDIYSTLPGDQYGSKSGTSMAAAHVSGLAGLLFALRSDKNGSGFVNDEVRAAIEGGCDAVDISRVKGRINAFHAVNKALALR
ncbi:MAG: peptidase S8 [Chloroflexi bacterium]|nr:peptidase S8 [Chloroflexota bacterium]